MVTGDTAVEKEAKELVGNIYTCVVKIGLNRYCCEIIHPKKAWGNIEKTAKEAVSNYKKVAMYNPSKPCELKMQYPIDTQLVDWVSVRPGIKRIDGSTISYVSDSLKEAVGSVFFINWWNLSDKPMI